MQHVWRSAFNDTCGCLPLHRSVLTRSLIACHQHRDGGEVKHHADTLHA
ncbi:hypothetical protein RBWH47_01074 [Rhodopirellula baltica WH47]|uniref:Uncharacterized protein n=1 Tax=Rhodopirellula baltica WH47 TaxID=991778 RepID=F2ANV9_RHOBT|nr:hypothetical protein RBWH47_01074 [Rhodopirellula baltica WH47]